MRPVSREEIVDYVTYAEGRSGFRSEVMRVKQPRRIHLGEHVTLLFENRMTVRYQVQEMMRTEQIVKEKDILHELSTYNELLGGPGELGATLLIEIDDPAERASKLSAWRDLMDHLRVRLPDGTLVPVIYDRRQVGEERLSSVQYVKFATGGQIPVALLSDHPQYRAETVLSAEQRTALAEDLRAD
jgi:hypothetical protein